MRNKLHLNDVELPIMDVAETNGISSPHTVITIIIKSVTYVENINVCETLVLDVVVLRVPKVLAYIYKALAKKLW